MTDLYHIKIYNNNNRTRLFIERLSVYVENKEKIYTYFDIIVTNNNDNKVIVIIRYNLLQIYRTEIQEEYY